MSKRNENNSSKARHLLDFDELDKTQPAAMTTCTEHITSIYDLTNIKTRSKSGFPQKFARGSEQDVVVTGNHTVTQHHKNKRVL